MRRLIPLFLLIVLLTPAVAKKRSNLRAELLKAKFVVVTTYPDGGDNVNLNVRGYAEDRRAIADVETAIRKWGRWTVLSSNNQADLIIAIRKGRLAGVGARVPTTGPTIGQPRMETEAGPADDMIAVFSAHGAESMAPGTDRNIDGPPMWRLIQSNALASPNVPGIQQLRKEIEKAEAENAKP